MIVVRIARTDPTKFGLRALHLDSHKTYLRDAPFCILLSGPFGESTADPAGSLVVAEVNSIAQMRDFSANDPFVLNGIYDEIRIFSWTVSINNLHEFGPRQCGRLGVR